MENDKDKKEEGGDFFSFLKDEGTKKVEDKQEEIENKGEEDKDKKESKESGKEKKQQDKGDDIDYKSKYEALSKFEDASRQEAVALIEENFEGETFQEKLDNFKRFREEATDKLPKVETYESELKKKDELLRNYDIRSTREWQEKAEKPYQSANEAFIATIADVDDDGNVRNKEFFNVLYSELLNEGKDMPATKIKSILNRFAAKYEEETGEEYKAPTIDQIVKTRESLVKAALNRVDMFNNWEKSIEENQKKTLIQQEEENKKLAEARANERRDSFNDVSREFDYDSLSPFFKKEEIQQEIEGLYKQNEKVFNGEEKPLSYGQLLQNATKAKLFDKLLNQAKLDRAFVLEHKESEDDSLDNKGGKGNEGGASKEKKIDLFEF